MRALVLAVTAEVDGAAAVAGVAARLRSAGLDVVAAAAVAEPRALAPYLALAGAVDVALALEPRAARALGSATGPRAPLVGVVLEPEASSAWRGLGVDRFAVLDEEAARPLGDEAARAIAVGPALAGAFGDGPAARGRAARRARYGLDPDRRWVVIDARGGVEATPALFVQLGLVRAGLLLQVGAASSDAAAARELARRYGVQAKMFGALEEAGELRRCADALVCPAAPFAVARGLAEGLALVALVGGGAERGEGGRLAAALERRGLGWMAREATLAAALELALAPATRAAAGAPGAARPGALSRLAVDVARAEAAIVAERAARAMAPGPATVRRPLLEEIGPSGDDGSLEEIGPSGDDGSLEAAARGAPAVLGALAERRERAALADAHAAVKEAERRAVAARAAGDEAGARLAELDADRSRLALHAALDALRALDEQERARASHGPPPSPPRASVDDELAALKARLKDEAG